MCFSASASFTASAFLALSGAASLRAISSNSRLFIALIPLIFALQQFCEGVLWIYLGYELPLEGMGHLAMYTFLVIAVLIWPIWIPMALLLAENVGWRKRMIGVVLLGGIGWFLNVLLEAPYQEVNTQVIGHSIHYFAPLALNEYIYLAIVVLPCLISSMRYAWLAGILVALSAWTAEYFFETTFVSVWCFFAALLSIFIYTLLRVDQKRYQIQNTSKKPLEKGP